MALLKNIARILEAPVALVDKTVAEPLAEIADAFTEAIGAKDDES